MHGNIEESQTYIVIQGASTPLKNDVNKKMSITFKRLLRHIIIQGTSTPLDEDMVKLATSSCKERTPRCMAT